LRLAAHVQVSALIRRVQAQGGFATVIAKGEPDAGTLLIILTDRGGLSSAYERMPQADGTRGWSLSRKQDIADPAVFTAYLARRKTQDPDLWIIELDIRDGERFIGDLPDS
jgi:hypothetical protein